MFWAARFLLLSCVVLFFENSSYAAASQSSGSGTSNAPFQFEEAKVMPPPEAVESEEPGLRYQFAIVQRVVQVTCYGAHGHAASMRVRVETGGHPEILGNKVRWAEAYGTAEWSLTGMDGTLALTATAGLHGESPTGMVLRFEGARSLSLDALGNLVIVTAAGDLHQQRPAVFNASAVPVASRYVLLGGNRVAVEVRTQHANTTSGVDSVGAVSHP